MEQKSLGAATCGRRGLIGIRILHFLAVSEEEKLINFRFLNNKILGVRLEIDYTFYLDRENGMKRTWWIQQKWEKGDETKKNNGNRS